MTVYDRVDKREIANGMHNGQGDILYYIFFGKEIDPSLMFGDLLIKPGDYAGYHQHVGNEEIIYVVSGKAENFQDGARRILGPGDAILVKPGQSHAIRNVGAQDLHLLGFGTVPVDEKDSIKNLPLPDELSDWEQ